MSEPRTVEVRTKIWEAMADKEIAQKVLPMLPGINKRLVERTIEIDGDSLLLYAIVSDINPEELK